MTQVEYDKILSEKISRCVSLYDRTTPMLNYAYGRELNNEEKRVMRILSKAKENVILFKARHSEFTASWLKKDYLKV